MKANGREGGTEPEKGEPQAGDLCSVLFMVSGTPGGPVTHLPQIQKGARLQFLLPLGLVASMGSAARRGVGGRELGQCRTALMNASLGLAVGSNCLLETSHCNSGQKVFARRQKTARTIDPLAISHPRIDEINSTFLFPFCFFPLWS